MYRGRYKLLLKQRTNLLQMPTVWRTGRIEPPFNAFTLEFGGEVKRVRFVMHSRRTFSASTKIGPLSDQFIASVPVRETNHFTSITREPVSADGKISTKTARVVRQVKRNPTSYRSSDEQ